MTKPDWKTLASDQRREIVRPLWIKGLSATQIAMKFDGATRNAIIGHVNRDPELRGVRQPRAQQAREKVKAAPKPRKPNDTKFRANRPPEIIDTPQLIAEMVNGLRRPINGRKPISLMDLPNREGVVCRFPVKGGYCGVPCGEKMYCEDHHAIMYTKIDRRNDPVRWANNRAKKGAI